MIVDVNFWFQRLSNFFLNDPLVHAFRKLEKLVIDCVSC